MLFMKNLFFVFFLFLLSQNLFSQSGEEYFLFRIKGGNKLYGSIVAENDQKISVKTLFGDTVSVHTKVLKIKQKLDVLRIKDSEIWIKNHQYQGNFISPNALGSSNGYGYAKSILGAAYQGETGLSDHLAVGANLYPTISLFLAAGFPVYKDQFHLGLRTYIGILPFDLVNNYNEGGFFAAPIGTFTIGNRENNLSGGFGQIVSQNMNTNIFYLNAMFRVSPKTYIMSDNIFMEEDHAKLFVLGARTIWPNFALDYGVFLSTSDGQFLVLPLPYLGFSIPLRPDKTRQRY